MKPQTAGRFAEWVATKCDDAAATGSYVALYAYESKCLRALVSMQDSGFGTNDTAVAIAHAADAAYWRARAVEFRLSGNISTASKYEGMSEDSISCIHTVAPR